MANFYDIRPLEEAELPRFESFPFGSMDTHKRRFGMQVSGKLVFLVAWQMDRPVGQVLLNWVGGDGSGVPPQVREWPEVSSLFVTPAYRRKGIASQMLDMAEQMTYAHGHNHVGLCVAEANRSAQILYARRGYRDIGWPPYLARGFFTNEKGQRCTWEESRGFLLKQLGVGEWDLDYSVETGPLAPNQNSNRERS
ncbi:MAG: GNAT family N-acetyltransferase [bacterium]|nr:GNAT family N-acetyltransferase [bacterium]